MKKYLAVVMVIGVVSLACTAAFAGCGICGSDAAKAGKPSAASTAPVKVNNTVCPVMGNKIDMKSPVTVEYGGKVYNLCCPACVKQFKANPEKYISKIKN